jgi:large subunit ribosomal protein L6e
MSATQVQKKTFGKSTREVPAASQKASKWYPAEDDAQHKKVRTVYYSRSKWEMGKTGILGRYRL